MRRTKALALMIVAAVFLSACGGASSPGPSGTPPNGSNAMSGVEGRTFLSTAVTGRSLVAGSRIRLSFTPTQVAASAGCNSMSGAYRVDGGRLLAPQLATTDMGCDPALMLQDQWVADLLNGSTLTLDGNTLTLARNGVTVTLLDRTVADPDRPLVGTRWVVDGVLSGSTASSVPAGATASLTFSDGRVDVETGCNTGSGTATIGDGSINFGDLSLTKRACPIGLPGLELAVVTVLRGTATYRIEAAALTLMNGASGLTLRAAP